MTTKATLTHHLSQRSPRRPAPGEPIQVTLIVPPEIPTCRAWVYYTCDGTDPDGQLGQARNGCALPMELIGAVWQADKNAYAATFRAEIPGQPDQTVIRYRISGFDDVNGEIWADDGQIYACLAARQSGPLWAEDAIVYHIFVDRFSPAPGESWNTPERLDGFFNGKLRGITAHLDYIQELGFNTIYLSPIFPSPSHHGYDATNYHDIEPRLGTFEDFTDLLEAVHARGMRLMLDFVPDHISNQHPFFQFALSDPENPYRSWFTFENYPDTYQDWMGIEELPRLNLANPTSRQYVIDAACYWLEMGVDGLRLDYALGPTPDFWADLRKATQAVRPDAWLIGEVLAAPDVQIGFDGLMDGCLDFTLERSIRATFGTRTQSAEVFAAQLQRHLAAFPAWFSRPLFLDNHDVNRFIWLAGGDVNRLKLAALCQFCLPGQPMVYYGTEVGLSQNRGVERPGQTLSFMEESRLPMLWGKDQNTDLHAFYTNLIHLRNQTPCLRTGGLEIVFASNEMLAFKRTCEADQMLVVMNLSEKAQEISLPGEWQTPLLTTNPGFEFSLQKGKAHFKLPGQTGLLCRSAI